MCMKIGHNTFHLCMWIEIYMCIDIDIKIDIYSYIHIPLDYVVGGCICGYIMKFIEENLHISV